MPAELNPSPRTQDRDHVELAAELQRARDQLEAERARVYALAQQRDEERDARTLAETRVVEQGDLLQQCNQLRVEIASLSERAAMALILEGERNAARREAESLQLALEEAQRSSSHALGVMQAERDEAYVDCERMRLEAQTLNEGFEAARKQIERMGRDLEALEAEGTRIEEEREAVSQLRKQLQELIGVREQTLAAREAEFERTRTREQALDERHAIVAQMNQLQGQFAESQREAAELARQVESTTADFQMLRALADEERSAHQAVVEELRAALDRLRAGHARLAQEREHALRELAERNNEISAIRAEVETLRKVSNTTLRASTSVPAGQNGLELKVENLRTRQDCETRLNGADLPSRPEPSPGQEPLETRTLLEHWLERAEDELEEAERNTAALSAEVRAARDTLDLLNRDLAIGDWDEPEVAFPFEEA